ncbi:TetR family transcriptional regulator [Nocardiopsis sp. CNT-189]|uniref:TetR family transcriptional regulator n=1 Tax=Nocardiopsis oceanisediminis TaxID=2816862 RepID=UPI003B386499
MTARTEHSGPPRTGGVRERLLDAAYGAVVAGGWPRMRMADIARTAAVSRQTLYNEFGTKEGLLQAVVLREADRFLDGVERILAGHEGAPADTVAAAARWTLATTAEDPLLRAIITGDDELLPVLTTRAEPLHVALEQRINAYLRRRHPGLDRRGEAMTEVAVRLSLSYVLLPTDPERAADRIVAAVAGIAEAPARGAAHR